jgi:hypothetical protein
MLQRRDAHGRFLLPGTRIHLKRDFPRLDWIKRATVVEK